MSQSSSLNPSTQTAGNLMGNHSDHSLTDDRMGFDANHSSSIIGAIANGADNTSHATFTIDNNSSNTLNNNSAASDNWLELPKMDNFIDIVALCCSTAVIVGSLVPYIPQYLKIKRSMNSDGFSTYVCLTLLIANILRIIFWFGHHFELPLLIQSFVVIAGMLILMELCVRVRDKSSSFTISSSGRPNRPRRLINGKRSVRSWSSESQPPSVYAVPSPPSVAGDTLSDSCSYQNNWRPATRPDAIPASSSASPPNGATGTTENPSFRYESLSPSCRIKSQHSYQSLRENIDSGSNSHWSFRNMERQLRLDALGTRDFWDWDDFNSYLYFLFLFTLAASLLTYLLIDNHLYIETLGFVAVLTESMLGMPQLIRNYSKKSTLGMSVEMVVMWLSGDLFKTLYFILRHAPRQFIVCGSIQVIVDIMILYQVLWYRRPKVNYRKLPTSVVR